MLDTEPSKTISIEEQKTANIQDLYKRMAQLDPDMEQEIKELRQRYKVWLVVFFQSLQYGN